MNLEIRQRCTSLRYPITSLNKLFYLTQSRLS